MATRVGRVVHLNHAGASPSSAAVVHRMQKHLALERIVGGYAAKDLVNEELQTVYNNAARLIHAASPSEIALVESATVAWTKLFYAFAAHQERHKAGERIILVSQAEYAANLVAVCQWARTHEDWSVLMIPSAMNGETSTGTVDLEALAAILAGNYKVGGGATVNPRSIALVCVTHVPTNSGIVNNVDAIGQQIADFNAALGDGNSVFYLADTCQSVGQLEVNVQRMHCSGLVATGRKFLRGPRGTGFLYIPNEIADSIMPQHIDHYGVPVLGIPPLKSLQSPLENVIQFAPRPGARRFEFWESHIAGRLGLGQALAEHLDLGQTKITEQILERATFLLDRLQKIPKVKLHHQSKCGIVTFFVPGMESAILATRLQESVNSVSFEISTVPATSTPLDTAQTGVPDLLRVSVSYTTSEDDMERFIQRLSNAIATVS